MTRTQVTDLCRDEALDPVALSTVRGGIIDQKGALMNLGGTNTWEGLTKVGTGHLILPTANTYRGLTHVNDGLL